MQNTFVTATHDPALAAVVSGRRELHYAAGPDPTLDRPASVRAASSIARVGSQLLIAQDDANFVALIDSAGAVQSLTLPVGPAGLRLFDNLRGNKAHKLDLEACAIVPGPNGDQALMFGSGSTDQRYRLVLVDGLAGPSLQARLVDATSFYISLIATPTFAGSELNIEGALYREGQIWLFNRGNGAPRAGFRPLDATCAIAWPALAAYLRDPARNAPPLPTAIMQYDLGAIDGWRLSFTDATSCPGGMLYSATAEASPDTVADGPVAGSALGVISEAGARWAMLSQPDGTPFIAKVEGLIIDSTAPTQATIIVDCDDPQRAAEIYQVELRGPWFS